MVTKSRRIPIILQKKLLENTKIVMYFDSSVNRDGVKERKVAKTAVRIKCLHILGKQ